MSDEEKKNKTTLVSIGNRRLAIPSSGLVKRGLQLISTVELRKKVLKSTQHLRKLLELESPKPTIEHEKRLLQDTLNDIYH